MSSAATDHRTADPGQATARPRGVVEVLARRVRETPGRRAYTFLENGEAEAAEHLTYGELGRRVAALSAELRRRGAAGKPVLLLLPSGLQFVCSFFACLHAGAIAVPTSPPGSRRTLPRLTGILRDARPALGLSTGPLLSRLRKWLDDDPSVPDLDWWRVDETEGTWAADPPGAAADDGAPSLEGEPPEDGAVAFLQYTSGSTSDPKGVMVRHGDLAHNQVLIRDACHHDADSVFVSWLPLFHDLGLIGNMIQAAYVGAPCVLMSPVAVLQQPARWLRAISHFRGTTSGGPNFAYDLCVRRVGEEACRELDLSSWRVAFNGAEPVRASTLDDFRRAFEPHGFSNQAAYPCYGLAEATLMVSGGDPGEAPRTARLDPAALERGEVEADPDGRPLVGCGRVLGDLRVEIVDPERAMPAPAGGVGEIWVAGGSVAGGYLGRPEATAETFEATLASGEGPFLRTGDLGFLRDGELFIAGRLKDLIILRGRNFYPQDLELTTSRAHPAFEGGLGAAFSVAAEEGEALVVVQESARLDRVAAEEAVQRVRQGLAEEHQVHAREVVLIRVGTLPRTTSGKVQRHRTRERLADGDLAVFYRGAVTRVGNQDGLDALAVEELLALEGDERLAAVRADVEQRVAVALGTRAGELMTDRPLASFGLDSLSAVELSHGLFRDLGVHTDVADLLGGATLEQVVEWVSSALDASPAPGAEDAGVEAQWARDAAGSEDPDRELPLTQVQEALWILHAMDPRSSAYNVALALDLPAGVDHDLLAGAVRQAMARHPALGARFGERDGTPFQVLAAVEPVCRIRDASPWNAERLAGEIQARAERSFDLEAGPAARAAILSRDDGGVLVLVVHHLAVDGWSLWQVLDEVARLYRFRKSGEPADIRPPEATYAEYLDWQAFRLRGKRGVELERYWKDRLADPPEPLELPGRAASGSEIDPPGGSVTFNLGPELSGRLRALADEAVVTPFQLFLAATSIWLQRVGGQRRFAIGTAVSGRIDPRFASVVGCFYNVLPVIVDLADDPSFGEHVQRVAAEVRRMIAHQEYPGRLLAELTGRTGRGGAGLFQVTFLWQSVQHLVESRLVAGEEGLEVVLPGLTGNHRFLERTRARQDLEIEILEAEGGLSGALHYDAVQFDQGQMERLASQLVRLLGEVAARPSARLSELRMVSPEDESQQHREMRGPLVGQAPGGDLSGLLTGSLLERPGSPVATGAGQAMTYGELDRRSRALAGFLEELDG